MAPHKARNRTPRRSSRLSTEEYLCLKKRSPAARGRRLIVHKATRVPQFSLASRTGSSVKTQCTSEYSDNRCSEIKQRDGADQNVLRFDSVLIKSLVRVESTVMLTNEHTSLTSPDKSNAATETSTSASPKTLKTARTEERIQRITSTRAAKIAPFPMAFTSPYRPVMSSRELQDLLENPSLLSDSLDADAEEDVDPSTLCPWCDKPMPPMPSKTLLNLMSKAKKASYLDPRASNSLGLKAPFHCYLDFCQRHKYEVEELPKATANGWPKSIRFKEIPERLESKRDDLMNFVMDKSKSVFWQSMSKEIQERGTLAMLSLGNQYSSLGKQVHAGYYGPRGEGIIMDTLFKMFPPESLDPQQTAPLDRIAFLTYIMLPEASTALVRDDLSLGKSDAIAVLRKSWRYGMGRYPA